MGDVEQARAWFGEKPERAHAARIGEGGWAATHAATIVRYDLAAGDDARTDDEEVSSWALREITRLRARAEAAERRVAELEAAELRLRERVAREADAPPQHRYLWCREIVDLLAGRLS